MKCQSLFSKKMENIISLSSVEFSAHGMVSAKQGNQSADWIFNSHKCPNTFHAG